MDSIKEPFAALRLQQAHADVPLTRGWSSATCACHYSFASCALSCCCPCVQFGLNQHAAFGASCFKWALLWLLPVAALYVIVDQLYPASEDAVTHLEHIAGGDDAAQQMMTAVYGQLIEAWDNAA